MDHNRKPIQYITRKKTFFIIVSILVVLACGIFPGGDDAELDDQIIPLIQDDTSTMEFVSGDQEGEPSSGLRIILSEGQALYQEVEPLSIATGDSPSWVSASSRGTRR